MNDDDELWKKTNEKGMAVMAEVNAMSACWRVLAALDSAARARAIRWLTEVHEDLRRKALESESDT